MKEKSIGGLLLDAEKISSADAERILRLQREKGLRFGDAGKALKLLTDDDIQQALSKQFNFPFLDANSGISKELVTAYRPFSPQIEVFRAIRSQLMLRWFADQKSLAIVSPSRQEGRSVLTANLAIVFSLLGERTLLIDGDLRQPRQRELFNGHEKKGLSDLLAERADMSIIKEVPAFNGLSILTSGTIPPNSSELISKKLSSYLEKFELTYDVILIDTPSVEQGTDALVLASKATGVLLLARQHHTRLNALENLKDSLESLGVTCVGSVVNDF